MSLSDQYFHWIHKSFLMESQQVIIEAIAFVSLFIVAAFFVLSIIMFSVYYTAACVSAVALAVVATAWGIAWYK